MKAIVFIAMQSLTLFAGAGIVFLGIAALYDEEITIGILLIIWGVIIMAYIVLSWFGVFSPGLVITIGVK